jgi:Tfp pilus assembly protein PilW
MNIQMTCGTTRRFHAKGFTLLEFLVAMTMFIVIGGAAFSLFRSHAPLFNQQQNTAAINIAMQNAVTQMQLDLENAGTGYYPNTQMPSWPVGVTIVNQTPTSNCYNTTTFTYTASCFDTLNVLTINPNVPPAHPTDSTGGTGTSNCSYAYSTAFSDTAFYIQPNSGQTPTQTAANFHSGDQVILITGANNPVVNTFVLTGAPTVGANYVSLPHAAANSDYTNSSANDPLSITTNSSTVTKLGTKFCSQDWVMKLEPTIYSVDASNSKDPKLTRFHGGTTDTIADQVIGFKVGASTEATGGGSDTVTYSFDASTYNYNFMLVRSVRVSVIGRTNPSPDATYSYRNQFDGGPYQVVGATVVINPRNMTMNNN